MDALVGVSPGAFLIASIVLIITPGQDMTLTARNTIAHGRNAGLATAGGLLVGVSVHALAAVLGLSALLLASETAFTVVKVAGALYLAYLGVRMILGSFGRADEEEGVLSGREVRGLRSHFAQGVVSAVLNPKLAVFFLTFLAQFVDPDNHPSASMLAHGMVFILLAAAWLWTWVSLLDRLGVTLRRPAARRWMERLGGAALVGLAARLALAHR